MRHHYLHNWCRGDTERKSRKLWCKRRWMHNHFRNLSQEKINFNRWSCFIISQCFSIMIPILKFRGHQKSESLREALSSHIQIIPQTFITTRNRPARKFISNTVFCGAQPLFGEQKMTLWEHFVRSPLRCLKCFLSSPSWIQRGWS